MQKSKLKQLIPIFDWLPGYQREWLKGDVIAGLSVSVLLIPQGLAYAMIAGLPPIYGLYAGLVPQVVYAIFGTSRQLAVGPVAMDSLLVAATLGTLGLAGEENYIVAALFLGLIVGVMQILMGTLRLGFLVNFLSRPVVSGFTSAAAIIIGLSQIKYVLGISTPNVSRLHQIISTTFSKLADANPYAIILGVATIVLVIVVKRYGRGIPSALVAIALGTLVAFLTGWDDFGLPIVGDIPHGFPEFTIPGIKTGLLRPLVPLAFTVALIGYTEAISIGRGLQDKYGGEIRPNQELLALGAQNFLGSFFGSYISTASFSRSAMNGESGGKTGVSGLVSALIIALTLLFLTPLFYYLPKAVLGAVILVAVFRLVNVQYATKLWRDDRIEFTSLALTFLVTLGYGMVEGILIGIFTSLAYTVYRDSTPHIAEVARMKGTDYFRNVDRFPQDVERREDVLFFRFDAPIFFGNAEFFKEKLFERIEKRNERLTTVVINSESITYIDSTGQNMLAKVVKDLQAKGIRVMISGAIGPTRDVILHGEIGKLISSEYMFVRSSEVIDFLDGRCAPSDTQQRIARQGYTIEQWRALQNEER